MLKKFDFDRFRRRVLDSSKLQVPMQVDQRSWIEDHISAICDRSSRPGVKTAIPDPDRKNCQFCARNTLPLVSIARGDEIEIPSETQTFEAARRWLADNVLTGESFPRLLAEIRPCNQAVGSAAWTVFGNVVPLRSIGACMVNGSLVAAPCEEFHDLDHSLLPAAVMTQQVKIWQLFCELADVTGTVPCVGINSGQGSGNSVFHAHSQMLLLSDVPAWRAFADSSHCPVCDLAERPLSLEITCPGLDRSLALYAHPAPLGNWSVLLAPRSHERMFAAADASSVAAGIQSVLRGLAAVFGMMPSYNMFLRSGSVPHWSIEFVVRSAGVPGFAEIATRETVVGISPERVRDELAVVLLQGVSV